MATELPFGGQEHDVVAHVEHCRARTPDFAGHYMDNYVIDFRGTPAVLRLPRPGDQNFDARMLAEADALTVAAASGARVPAPLFASDGVIIESFCDGALLDLAAGSWEMNLQLVLRELGKVHRADPSTLNGPSTVRQWRDWMRSYLEELWSRLAEPFADRYHEVGLGSPELAWQAVDEAEPIPSRRPCLVHADLHQSNILVAKEGVWLLDWELALVGDPLWDCAVSLHRTRWLSTDQFSRAADLWHEYLFTTLNLGDVTRIIDAYRHVELWKSVAVDIIRYPREIRDVSLDEHLVARRRDDLYAKTFELARRENRDGLGRTTVETLLRRWASDDGV